MSFQTICNNCGAPSGPSVGMCPFCKSVMVRNNVAAPEGASAMMNAYAEGNIEKALQFANLLQKNSPALFDNEEVRLTLAKIMLEAEAPPSTIRSILAEGLLKQPASVEFKKFLQLIDARDHFTSSPNDEGEKRIYELLKEDPNHAHALFVLGTHLFHVDHNPQQAAQLLEKCVKVRPTFLRAWGCLGAIYAQLGNKPLAGRAFTECLKLETDPVMKEVFQGCLNQVRS